MANYHRESKIVRKLKTDAPKVNARKTVWNTLEFAKLIVSISTPLTIFAAGYHIQNQQYDLNDRKAIQQRLESENNIRFSKLLDKRSELWDKLGPVYARINLLAVEGGLEPKTLSEIKKLQSKTNEIVVTYQLYFSPKFIEVVEGYDDTLERHLSGDRNLQDELWHNYKALRRAVAKDMSLDIDRQFLKWEGVEF